MKIFVTGGTGFIGSHVVGWLRERGHQLVLFSRKDQDRLEPILADFRPEAALHLAWEGLPDYSWPLCLKNLKWGLELYEALLRNGCRKIITTGTCWEYGDTNAFVAAKTSLRLMGESLARDKKSEFIWARLFFVYGPGQRKTSLIPSLIQMIKQKQELKLKSPTARHDFVYVKDVARALVLLAEKETAESIVDIGSGELHSVGEVAQCVVKRMQNEPAKIKPAHHAGVPRADISKLKQLGWKQEYDLVAGIRETLQ